MRLEYGRLWGCSSIGRIHGPLKLCYRVVTLIGYFRSIIGIPSTEIDKFWRIWYLLTGPTVFNEVCNVLFNITILKGKSNLLARLNKM
jgi:hypothetical protein